MKDVDTSSEQWRRVQTWTLVLILRSFGCNIYNDDSYIWKLLEMSNKDIDSFFLKLIGDDKLKWGQIARGLNKEKRTAEIRSR